MDVLETPRLRLRPFALSDAETAHAWFGDPVVMRYTPTGPDRSVAATRERLRGYCSHQAANGFGKWLISDRASGAAIGDAGLLLLPDQCPGGKWIDLGFRLRPTFWRQGLATEVAAAWISAARDHLQLHRLHAFAHVDNVASIRVLEKVGFAVLRAETIMGLRAITFALDVRPAGGGSACVAVDQTNPWLHIPGADYEAHMQAVGQAGVLRALFSRVYEERSPVRLAILGCTTGHDFDVIDPGRTRTTVAVDVNPAYIAWARARCRGLGLSVHLLVGDVLDVDLLASGFDLIHAALLFEYTDPAKLLRRIRGWLSSDGLCSVITQQPDGVLPAVSATPYTSLQLLSGRVRLLTADEVKAMAAQADLEFRSSRQVTLPSGKTLVQSLFGR